MSASSLPSSSSDSSLSSSSPPSDSSSQSLTSSSGNGSDFIVSDPNDASPPHLTRVLRTQNPRRQTKREKRRRNAIRKELANLADSESSSSPKSDDDYQSPQVLRRREIRRQKNLRMQQQEDEDDDEDVIPVHDENDEEEEEEEEVPDFTMDADSENSKSNSEVEQVTQQQQQQTTPPSSPRAARRRPRRKAAPLSFHDAFGNITPGSYEARRARAVAEARRRGLDDDDSVLDTSIPSHFYSSQQQQQQQQQKQKQKQKQSQNKNPLREHDRIFHARRRPNTHNSTSNEHDAHTTNMYISPNQWTGPQPTQRLTIRNAVYQDVRNFMQECRWNREVNQTNQFRCLSSCEGTTFMVFKSVGQVFGFRCYLERPEKTTILLAAIETDKIWKNDFPKNKKIKRVVKKAVANVFGNHENDVFVPWDEIEEDRQPEQFVDYERWNYRNVIDESDEDNDNDSDNEDGDGDGHGNGEGDGDGNGDDDEDAVPSQYLAESHPIEPLSLQQQTQTQTQIPPQSISTTQPINLESTTDEENVDDENEVIPIDLPSSQPSPSQPEIIDLENNNDNNHFQASYSTQGIEEAETIEKHRVELLQGVTEFANRCSARESYRVAQRFPISLQPVLRMVARTLGAHVRKIGVCTVELVKDGRVVLKPNIRLVNFAVNNAVNEWAKIRRGEHVIDNDNGNRHGGIGKNNRGKGRGRGTIENENDDKDGDEDGTDGVVTSPEKKPRLT